MQQSNQLLPRVRDYSAKFWSDLRDGTFNLQVCTSCGERYFPPRIICPTCRSQRFKWQPTAGIGTIYTFSKAIRVPTGYPSPSILAIVDLQEGIRLLTEIVGDGEPSIGAKVKLRSVPINSEISLFKFEVV
jgi:uncharacterized OB-fold protein